MDQKEIAQETTDVYMEMLPEIDAIINKMIGFTRIHEREDYRHQAWEAIRKGLLRYSPLHVAINREKYSEPGKKFSSGETVMRRKTYAQYYVRKELGKMADTKEVEYQIYNRRGDYITTLTNSEYRKSRQDIEAKGYSVRSFRTTHCFTDMSFKRSDGRYADFDPADMNTELDIAV